MPSTFLSTLASGAVLFRVLDKLLTLRLARHTVIFVNGNTCLTVQNKIAVNYIVTLASGITHVAMVSADCHPVSTSTCKDTLAHVRWQAEILPRGQILHRLHETQKLEGKRLFKTSLTTYSLGPDK